MRHAARPQPPQLPAQLEAGEAQSLTHDAVYSETAIDDVALSDQQARGVVLRAVELTKVDLSGSRLDHLRVVDGALANCNMANMHCRGADIARVTITSSRLTGIGLAEAVARDLTIRDCRIDLASFGFSRLERVTFEDCLLSQTDFLETQLDSVRFHGCDLTGADFRGARLKRCEFRRSDLIDLQGVESLRGAAMEWPYIVEMAGVWAAALGIEVLDAD
jgi:uncharacterized protein YjbI with pentapeptide repeats